MQMSEAVAQPRASQAAQPATRPPYPDISGKYHGVPLLMVEDLRLMESFVDPSTQSFH
jgi:hypothetical protein